MVFNVNNIKECYIWYIRSIFDIHGQGIQSWLLAKNCECDVPIMHFFVVKYSCLAIVIIIIFFNRKW